MKKRLPKYIARMIRAVFREEEFEVDPTRLPKGWTYERQLLEPGEHWGITVMPEDMRAFSRAMGPFAYCAIRVGRYSYNFLCPIHLLPDLEEMERRFEPCTGSVLPLLTPDGSVVPILYPPSEEVA